MFYEIEQLSRKQKKWIPHPKINFVYIYGTKYMCQICEKENLNRGSMNQHIRSKKHQIDFYTGESLIKQTQIRPPSESQPEENSKEKLVKEIIKEQKEDTLDELIRQLQEDNERQIIEDIRKAKLIHEIEKVGFPQIKIGTGKLEFHFIVNQLNLVLPIMDNDVFRRIFD